MVKAARKEPQQEPSQTKTRAFHPFMHPSIHPNCNFNPFTFKNFPLLSIMLTTGNSPVKFSTTVVNRKKVRTLRACHSLEKTYDVKSPSGLIEYHYVPKPHWLGYPSLRSFSQQTRPTQQLVRSDGRSLLLYSQSNPAKTGIISTNQPTNTRTTNYDYCFLPQLSPVR